MEKSLVTNWRRSGSNWLMRSSPKILANYQVEDKLANQRVETSGEKLINKPTVRKAARWKTNLGTVKYEPFSMFFLKC
jgi:hypothetical protein